MTVHSEALESKVAELEKRIKYVDRVTDRRLRLLERRSDECYRDHHPMSVTTFSFKIARTIRVVRRWWCGA